MKNECNIIRDLLFSYNDDILSTTSKELVEEHLKRCENCKKFLEEIKKENSEEKEIKEIDFLKKIKKNINKKNKIILVFLIISILIVLFNIQVYNNYKKITSTMVVYLNDNITEKELNDIKDVIRKSDNAQFEYISKEKSLEKMKNNLKENDNLLDGYNNQNNPFPASIEIKTDNKIEAILENIQDMPGIEHIVTYINQNPYELYISNFFEK